MTLPGARPLLGLAALLWALALVAVPAPALAEPAVPLPGEPVEGSERASTATGVAAGSWQVVVPPSGDGSRFFEYQRTYDNSTVHVSVLASSRTTESDSFEFQLSTPDGEDCGGDGNSGSSSASVPGSAAAFAASYWVGVEPTEEGALLEELPCVTTERLVIELGRGFSESSGDLDVSMTIIEEAPVESSAELPASVVEVAAYESVDAGEPEELAGGSLADPTAMESGQAASGTLRTGEFTVYRVELGWGQTVHARASAEAVPAIEFSGGLGVYVLDPRFSFGYGESKAASLSATERAVATAVAGPVRYRNRIDDTAPFLPGTYYVAVGADRIDGEPVEVPYTLELEVTGEVDGEPDYGVEDPFVFADGVTGKGIESPAEVASGGWTATRAATVAGLALLGLVSLGGGVTLLRRR